MRCPYCGGLDTQVKDSRPTEDASSIRRRRVCPDCGGRFTTFERVQLRELQVVKKNGRRAPFDRDKLVRSVHVALRKRSVEPDRVERMINGVVRQLESQTDGDIPTERIGELVMEGLKALDDVAYVRFASVYRNFREARDFNAIVGELEAEPDPRRRATRRAGAGTLPLHERSDGRRPRGGSALDGGGSQSGIAVARPYRPQSVRRRDPGEGRGGRRARGDRAGGKAARRADRNRQAGEAARGSTLYVTLEPCSHFGFSPPCADLIVEAGVERVVSAIEDPNPLVAGQGHARLRAAGISVSVGTGAAQARRDHRGHVLRVTVGRPSVTLKLAETADGFASGGSHDPRLRITGQIANLRVQVMRSMREAIMIGVGTAIADDPALTVRLAGVKRKPLRVVLDTHFRLPAALASRQQAHGTFRRLWSPGRTRRMRRLVRLADLGVMIERVPLDADRRVDLNEALLALTARGVTWSSARAARASPPGSSRSGSPTRSRSLLRKSRSGGRASQRLTDEARAALNDPSRYRLVETPVYGPDATRVWERVDSIGVRAPISRVSLTETVVSKNRIGPIGLSCLSNCALIGFEQRISFLPFPTPVLGHYTLDGASQTTAATCYSLETPAPADRHVALRLLRSEIGRSPASAAIFGDTDSEIRRISRGVFDRSPSFR